MKCWDMFDNVSRLSDTLHPGDHPTQQTGMGEYWQAWVQKFDLSCKSQVKIHIEKPRILNSQQYSSDHILLAIVVTLQNMLIKAKLFIVVYLEMVKNTQFSFPHVLTNNISTIYWKNIYPCRQSLQSDVIWEVTSRQARTDQWSRQTHWKGIIYL